MSNAILEQEQRRELVQGWWDSPILRHYSFFDSRLWSKQEEILWAVRQHSRVVVRSGHTVGKSFLCADIILDYLTLHQPSKVIVLAPTFHQVESIIFRELATAISKAKIPIDGELLKTELRFSGEWFCIGLSPEDKQNLQGYHSPRLMVILDEAGGIRPEIWEAVEGLHPHRIFAVGNPIEPTGNFYDCFQSPLWHKVKIDCNECVEWQDKNETIPGLVTREWIEERRADWGDKSSLYQSRVLGEFPEDAPDLLIQRQWVEDARKRVIDEDDEEYSHKVVASDVATKHGGSQTVVLYRYGHTIVKMEGHLNYPTTGTTGLIKRWYEKNKADCIVVDSDGVGEGVADMLAEQKIGHVEFHGGSSSKAVESHKFANLRTQFYWLVGKKFEKGLYSLNQLDEKSYEILKNQLCSVKEKAPDSVGRIRIETKEDMAARQIKSPDYADAFVYGEYGFFCGRQADIKPYRWR